MRKARARNLKVLKVISDAVLDRGPQHSYEIKKVVQLYEAGKIRNYETARKVIDDLVSKKPKVRQEAKKDFDKKLPNWEEHGLTSKAAIRKKEAKNREPTVQISLSFNLYRKPLEDENVRGKKSHGGLVQKYHGTTILYVPESQVAKTQALIQQAKDKMISEDAGGKPTHFMETIAKYTDKSDPIRKAYGYEPDIVVTPIAGVRVTDFKTVSSSSTSFNPQTASYRKARCIGINSKYTITELKPAEESDFHQAMLTKSYRENECWINTLFDIYGGNLLRQDKQPRYRITREKILESIGVTEEEVQNGITFEQIERFFSTYNIPFYAYDEFYDLIYSYVPEKRNHNYPILYCICKNEHVYICNYNVKELQQQGQMKEAEDVSVSSYFRLPKEEPFEPYQMVNGLSDLLKKVQAKALEGDGQLNLIHYDNDLVHLTVRMVEEGYHPSICFNVGDITAIFCKFKCGKSEVDVMVRTQRPVVDSLDTTIIVDTAEEFNSHMQARQAMHLKLFRREYMSAYSPTDVDILDLCRTVANSCKLRPLPKHLKTVGVDLIKAHTAFLCSLTELPVFNEFDAFREYDGSDVEPLSFYVVSLHSDDRDLFFTSEYTLVVGSILLEKMKTAKYPPSIRFYNRPSNIKQVDFKQLVQDLYALQLSDDVPTDKLLKKNIINVAVGLLGKSKNKKSVASLYQSFQEAAYYKTSDHHRILPIREGAKDYCYIVTQQEERSLQNGFRYIWELILQRCKHAVSEAVQRLEARNVKVYGVNSDELIINAEDLQTAQEVIAFGTAFDSFGKWRVTEYNRRPARDFMFKVRDNRESFSQISMRLRRAPKAPAKIPVSDEYDTEAICQSILEAGGKGTIIRGRFAGSGKSYICKHFRNMGKNVVFVCPTNELAQSNDGVTLNKFFGIAMDEGTHMTKFDDSEYDVVVFEEIYMCNVFMLARIQSYVANTEKIILATGDCNQLEAIGNTFNNVKDMRRYTEDALNRMFSHHIYLEVCKRLSSEADRAKLTTIEQELFHTLVPIMDIIKKHFKITTTHDTNRCLAYTRETCLQVGKVIRKRLNRTSAYEVGEILVCREYIKLKKGAMHVNYKYVIEEVVENSISLRELAGNAVVTLPVSVVQSKFMYDYCRTVHSFQGATIDEEITAYDWNLPYVSRYWVWTLITRVRDLNHISFYLGSKLNHQLIDDYLRAKVHAYKVQDAKAKRPVDEQVPYVNTKWLCRGFGLCCQFCGDTFSYEVVDGKVTSNLTADRVDNSLPHYADNVQYMCTHCNQSKSNK